MKKLLEALESATNVKSIKYNTKTKQWTVRYEKGQPDKMPSSVLIDFLKNG